MPITEELKNIRKYESVSFTHKQAETIAETIEAAQTAGLENLKEFIKAENNKLRNEIKESENKLSGHRRWLKWLSLLLKVQKYVTVLLRYGKFGNWANLRINYLLKILVWSQPRENYKVYLIC